MIDKGCPSADDPLTRAVKRLKILLSGRFDRHEPHCWARGGFVNSFGIRGVVLRSFDERLHEAWIDQQNPAAISEKAPALIVRAGTRLHRDRLWSQLFDGLDQLGAAYLTLSCGPHSSNIKDGR
jgi:hypothetical protein